MRGSALTIYQWGCVTGLALILAGIILPAGVARAAAGVTLSIPSTVVRGNEFQLAVQLNGLEQLDGFDLRLSYDRQMLEGVGMQLGSDLAGGMLGVNQIGNGSASLAIGFGSSINLTADNTDLVLIIFKALAAGSTTIKVDRLDIAVPATTGMPALLSLDCIVRELYVLGSAEQTAIFGAINLEGVPAEVADHNRYADLGILTELIVTGTTDVEQLDGSRQFSTNFVATADGGYTCSDLPAGTYSVIARRPGYLAHLVAAGLRIDPGVPVNLATPVLLTGDLGPVSQENQDLSGDNQVDVSDLKVLKSVWGNQVTIDDRPVYADLDWDGRVGLVDLALLLRNFSRQGDLSP